ncbi:MAG: hypothetical protein JWO56_3202 [Acidobacteria bacterium]|nr:hypothetical protein [Acidobacteriota bacterium]
MAAALPDWSQKLIALHAARAANQFILYGNVGDRFLIPTERNREPGSLYDFLERVMMPRFDVVLSYDLGNGIRVQKGAETLAKWPAFRESSELPRAPRAAVEWLTRYFRFAGNLCRLGQSAPQIGFYMKSSQLVAPAAGGALSYDLNALAMLMRDWASDDLINASCAVTWLVAENLNDLHPLVVTNPNAASVEIPLPPADELRDALTLLAPSYPVALSEYANDLESLARQFTGATLTSVENLLRIRNHDRKPLTPADLVGLKKSIVEKDAGGLIEFIESKRTLDDVYAQDKLKAWLRQDIALWRMGDLRAMPMGYLICGPVGTGKTYLVECLAGEAGVPVVKMKNFRDRWVGSSEGNLEKIFRLLHGLGRCFVFIDEADQALGKRDAGNNDSGLSGRIYSMFAEQMSRSENRGRILWILASSRPDLIEVDLKRPGRVDVKIPIFPTTTPEEGFALIRALCERRGVGITEGDFEQLAPLIPHLLTPGAAEALAVKVYRSVKVDAVSPLDALRRILTGYRSPVPLDVMQRQIDLAVRESSDAEFVPEQFRDARG